MNVQTWDDETLTQAKEICSRHNRLIPAIKELRPAFSLGLKEAKDLAEEVWNQVEHPEHVDYPAYDREPSAPDKRVSRKLGLIELISRIGEDNILIEPTHDNLCGAQSRKGGLTEIRLLTSQVNPTQIASNSWPKVGLVVWMPRELVDKVREDFERSRNER